MAGLHNIQDVLQRADMTVPVKAFNVPSLSGVLFAAGPTVPTDGTAGYGKGCLFLHVDGTGAGDLVYRNEGSGTSCDFDNLEGDITAALAAVTTGNGASLVGIEDAGAFTAAATVEAALAEIYQHIITAQGIIPLPLANCVESADGDALAKHVDGGGTIPGLFAAAEIFGIRWNNNTTPVALATNFLMPPDCNIAANMELHILASKTSTEAIATTFDVEAFNNHPTAGALYDADADFGGTTSAMSNPGVAKSVEEVTLAFAAANLAAFPNSVHLTVVPTSGTLTTDDVIIHQMWVEYTRKLLAS